MCDGARLHTVIVVPHGAHGLPMLLERTPYDATIFVKKEIPHLRDAAWSADREWIDDGCVLVFQDVRGKYGSDGAYTMTRPPIGPFNPSKTDDTTDAWDTTDWLSRHVPESNGRIGEIGSSHDGWTVAMALLGPSPALKVAAPESPMVDGWMGDDWFHYGAFRQTNLDYLAEQTSVKGKGGPVPRDGAGAEHPVPALRPQPADLRPQHPVRPPDRLPPRHHDRRTRHPRPQRRAAAGRAAHPASRLNRAACRHERRGTERHPVRPAAKPPPHRPPLAGSGMSASGHAVPEADVPRSPGA